ncbi:MAG: uracil-DNA glycosylase [Gammaproteobacteria bacterium]|nr:uracil-DNA glycosylase [Gammaproteobacteria bacterium]
MVDKQQHQILDAMGIQVWELRHSIISPIEQPGCIDTSDPEVEAKVEVRATPPAIAKLDWQDLQQTVAGCQACELHSTRTQTVFGVGDQGADWLFVGEAPGAEEDRRGEPFVGRAGQLLNAMLFALNLKREQVYIANVLKCRPPANRDPAGKEVQHCEPYLLRQVELIQPRIIVALGRFAAQSLLKTTDPISRLRGRSHQYADTGIPLVVSYHPAYLLRSPIDKKKAWADLCLAQSLLGALS